MGTTLTGTTPQDTYDSLIKVTDNGPISATAKYLSDGLGNDSVLALSTARVGVGTATPTHLLQIFAASAPELRLGDATTTIQMYTAAAEAVLGTVGSHPFVFRTNAAERLRITSAGNVGIGTSAPAEKLSVAGAIISTGAITGHGANRVSISQEGANGAFIQSYGANASTVGAFTFRQASSDFSITQIPLAITTSGVLDISSGIKFPATQVAQADANTLDDYEEGTWTMGVTFGGASVGVTFAANSGTYTKIGRQVTVNGLLVLTSKGSSTGDASITGLPFTVANGLQFYSAAALRLENVTFTNQFQGYGENNTTRIELEETTILGVTTKLTNADFANNSAITVSLTYFV